jgi:hypothetical protein
MSIKTHITDPASGIKVSVDNADSTEDNALVVATRDLKTLTPNVFPFINPVYGIDINQDASAGGTPIKIHDGIDSVLWTGSSIVGVKVTFDSTDQNHTAAGSQSVKFNNTSVGDIIQFAKGSTQSLADHVSITMWIYVDSNWSAIDDYDFYGYDTSTGLIVGNAISLKEYFDWSVFGEWHKVSIPLIDLGLENETVDSFRIETTAKQLPGAIFYVDDLQIEETGGSITFTLAPTKGLWYHIKEYRYLFAGPYDPTLADSTLPKIPYDSFLNVPKLETGILYRPTIDGVARGFQLQQLMDFFQIPDMRIVSQGSDGTNTWIVLSTQSDNPLTLKSENGDKFDIVISDDLSGLLIFRAFVFVDVEVRQPGVGPIQ